MADTAAHLVDRVLPEVPVRQWVLSLPWQLRYRLAFAASHGQPAALARCKRENAERKYRQHGRSGLGHDGQEDQIGRRIGGGNQLVIPLRAGVGVEDVQPVPQSAADRKEDAPRRAVEVDRRRGVVERVHELLELDAAAQREAMEV